MKVKKAHALCALCKYLFIEESLLVDKKSMWIGYGLLKQSASDEKILVSELQINENKRV